MQDHVLVPIDGSPLSWEALRHALSTYPDATLTVLHVVDLFEPGYGVDPDVETAYEPLMGTAEWYERAQAVSEQLYEEAREIADRQDRDIETVSEIGDPERLIVEIAEDEGIDHIVLGAHGRPDATRPVFGRVAELVARRASMPVTLIR